MLSSALPRAVLGMVVANRRHRVQDLCTRMFQFYTVYIQPKGPLPSTPFLNRCQSIFHGFRTTACTAPIKGAGSW